MARRSSYVATGAGFVGSFALVLAIVAPGLIQIGAATPMAGFYGFGLGLLLGLIALVLGGIGLLRTRAKSGRAGRGGAWTGTAVGAVLTGVLLFAAVPGRSLPPINDITTDLEDPPAFAAAARHPENQGRDLGYPGNSFAQAQLNGYPDLAPILLKRSTGRVFEDVKAIVEELGWTPVLADSDAGLIEAYDVTPVFRFVDDVVIRIRADGSGSVVDMRSKSRDGRGDIGANANRIRNFASLLRAKGAP